MGSKCYVKFAALGQQWVAMKSKDKEKLIMCVIFQKEMYLQHQNHSKYPQVIVDDT